jgi:hypothetical protein
MASTLFCDVATLRDGFAGAPWKADREAVLGAAREAWELGHGAYAASNASDTAIAERLLYVIHRHSAFGPPVAAVAAIVWANLIQAKLGLLLPPVAPRGLEEEEMVAELERGVADDGTHAHALLKELAADRTLRGYRVFLKNWYGMASGFTEFLVSVAQRATPAMRGGIVENLSEEIFDETPHIDLRARVLAGVGTRFDADSAPEDPEVLTETFSLINWRAAASALPDPCLALGLFYSIEANWRLECEKHLAALRGLGVADDHLTSFVIHVDKDEDHAAEWLAMIRRAVTSPRDRGAVVRGLTVEFAVRRAMYDALRSYLYAR